MKIVGKRRPHRGGVEKAAGFLELVIALRGKKPFIPKGVHRFKSFEESEAWTLKMLTRPRNPGRP
jgi:hypothetical protein